MIPDPRPRLEALRLAVETACAACCPAGQYVSPDPRADQHTDRCKRAREALAALPVDVDALKAEVADGHPPSIVKAYRKRLNYIRNAQDERDLYVWKSLEFEKLKKPRDHQHSVRLNDQWRLILEFSGEAPNKALVIVAIEDYH
jgi:proteic killer suppression protein